MLSIQGAQREEARRAAQQPRAPLETDRCSRLGLLARSRQVETWCQPAAVRRFRVEV